MTDLYETPDLPEEQAAAEDKPADTIEQITARMLGKQAARIAELERELAAALFDMERMAVETMDCAPCKCCKNEGSEMCEICVSHYTFEWRGPVAGENVEVKNE